MGLIRDCCYAVVGIVTAPVWGYRLLSTGKWRTDWSGRFGHASVDLAVPGVKTLLIHAVSVGEVNAIRALVEQLRNRHDDALRIVIAVTTDTGFARATAAFGADLPIVRYPLDFSASVRRFLDTVRPDAVALVELEVWPTFVEECERRGAPVFVINGRLSERSYRRYSMVRKLVAPTFARLAHAAVQDEAYAERFVGLGTPADRVAVTGTMKWDTAVLDDDVPGSDDLLRAMGIDPERPLIVCGSTGPGEERMLVDALGGGEPQLLLAPRKPERFGEAAAAMGDPVRRSEHPDGTQREVSGDFFLLDTLGELGRAYALADVVVVGRTFAPMGGSDMIEPIALGKPTIVGPHTQNFSSQMVALLEGEGVIQVAGIDNVGTAVGALIRSDTGRALAERGRSVIRQQQGATGRHADLIASILDLR